MTVEERLTAALEHRASTTTVAETAWGGIERRRRRAAVRRASVPVLILLLLGVGTTLVVAFRQGPTHVAAVPLGTARYAPVGLDGRYTLVDSAPWPGVAREPGETRRIYVRRGIDGVSQTASLEVVTFDPPAAGVPLPVPPGGGEVAVRGHPAQVGTSDGATYVGWVEPGGAAVLVIGSDMAQDEVVATAGAVEVLPGGARITTPPDGFAELPASLEYVADRAVSQVWHAAEHPEPGVGAFRLTEFDGNRVSLGSLGPRATGSRRSDVQGKPAVFNPATGLLAWAPGPGVVLVLEAYSANPGVVPPTFSEWVLQSLASSVRPVDEATWRRIESRADPRAGRPR